MRLLTLAATLSLLAAGPAAARVGGDYVFKGDIDLGKPGSWDYATLDPTSGRLFVGHLDKLSAVDLAGRQMVGAVSPLDESHGAAFSPTRRKGYASSGGDGVVKVFDPTDLHVITTIAVGKDADGVLHDSATDSILVIVGDGKQVAIIDPATDKVTRTMDLPAEPEFAALDGKGKLYVNLVTTAQLAKIDIAGGRIEAVWPLAGCQRPHGAAYDPHTARLFIGCANKIMVVVDPVSGRNVAQIPIGGGNDAVGVDPVRGRVFSPNGEGTLTVIQEGPNDTYAVIRTLPTFVGARTMAVDPKSGTLYLVHGDTKLKERGPDRASVRLGWDNARVAVFEPND